MTQNMSHLSIQIAIIFVPDLKTIIQCLGFLCCQKVENVGHVDGYHKVNFATDICIFK